MDRHCRLIRQLLFASAVWIMARTCFAQVIVNPPDLVPVIGPSVYRSAADSPFPVNGSNPNFFLENFEDGQLNTPGINSTGTVQGPGQHTRSVDADDGSIDGIGSAGHSYRSNVEFTVFTDPGIATFPLSFNFNQQQLGFLPNAFGVVWTNGQQNSAIQFFITLPSGDQIATVVVPGMGDVSAEDGTANDLFVGVTVPQGIVSVEVQGTRQDNLPGDNFVEIDHVQYGLLVPEPPGVVLLAVGGFLLLAWRGRRQSHTFDCQQTSFMND